MITGKFDGWIGAYIDVSSIQRRLIEQGVENQETNVGRFVLRQLMSQALVELSVHEKQERRPAAPGTYTDPAGGKSRAQGKLPPPEPA